MGAWKLELVRLWRTRHLIALAAIFLLLGLGLPILTYYLPDLVKNASNGVKVIAPRQTPADAIRGFATNAAQLGTLVAAIVTAATVTIDANPALAAFYRTRVRSPACLLLPRYLTVTAATIAAFALGTLAAWYETDVLLGPVDIPRLMAGFALEAFWFCFATSIVTLCTTGTRSTLGAVGTAIALLLALSFIGNLTSFSDWLPTRLSGGAADLIRHPDTDIWRAILTTTIATGVALTLGIRQLGTREPVTANSQPG